jgi:hypothetical protein
MNRIRPIVIRGDKSTLARLEDEYRRYQGLTVRRNEDNSITVLPRRNRNELNGNPK